MGLNINDFSMEDLVDFAIQYYEILGVYVFRENFVKPLGNDIITQIAQQVNIKTPLTNHEILLTNKERIGLLNKLFFTFNSSKINIAIKDNQIPIIDYSNPIIRFIDIKDRKEKTSKEDREIIKLCVENYITQYGYEQYVTILQEFFFEIFKVSTYRFSELFSGFKKKVNYVSYNSSEIELVKRKMQLEFSTLDKQLNSPFILVISKLIDVNYEWIEMECAYVIYQSKSYFSNNRNDSSFYITHDENQFLEMINKIPNENTYMRVEFLHKPPKKKEDPNQERTLIEELRKKVANDNSQPLRRVA